MDMTSGKPELSIIVPVLNEAGIIQGLIRNLAEQRDVDFEVVICDGGSTDGTSDKVMEAACDCFFPVRIVACERGRGRQMNEGAAAARGSFLLFLHSDSIFRDRSALKKAIDELESAMAAAGHARVAGRFALRFRLLGREPSLLYYYHESKARLDRGECIHGDQGVLLGRLLFDSAGPFDESMPVLEDTLFAERVRKAGQWILLPCEIFTSARRFEKEGPVEREILNALIMTLAAAGRGEILREMPGIYSGQDQARRLRLFPFFHVIRKMIRELPFRDRMRFWGSCGSYALENAWQIAFALDVRRNFRGGLPPGEGKPVFLDYFDRRISRAARNTGLKTCAAVIAWLWFHITLIGRYLWEKGGRWNDE
ncbi:MAG TPA: TIGR04283 family arsenosugar biosynthesis glycosyltransferase [Geobacteraceae bacterium]|nr:TIGR04283 family arsenosugar biosynthesis glycosyltransferase [Geobacteraceae bacterium]